MSKENDGAAHFCLAEAHAARAHEAICANTGHNRQAPTELSDVDTWECVISELHITKQQAEEFGVSLKSISADHTRRWEPRLLNIYIQQIKFTSPERQRRLAFHAS